MWISFFCLVYYLPDPTLHWAPRAFDTNTPFLVHFPLFFLWRHSGWRHDDVTSSKNVNLTSSVLPLANIDIINGVAMFLLVRNLFCDLIGSFLVHETVLHSSTHCNWFCSKVEKGCLKYFKLRIEGQRLVFRYVDQLSLINLPGRDIRIHVCKNVTDLLWKFFPCAGGFSHDGMSQDLFDEIILIHFQKGQATRWSTSKMTIFSFLYINSNVFVALVRMSRYNFP